MALEAAANRKGKGAAMTFDNDTIYYIAMLVIYSGLGSWLIGQLFKNTSAERAERRTAVKDNLDLMANLDRLRETVSEPTRKQSLETIRARLLEETSARIEELNKLADQEKSNPSHAYLVVPPPRSFAGVVLSLIFAASVYLGVGALLMLGVAFWSEANFDPVAVESDRIWTMSILIFSGVAALAAIFARYSAFRVYNRKVLAMRSAAKS